MLTHTVLIILLAIGGLIFISVRQMRWQRTGSGLMAMPIVLALVGVYEAATTWNGALLARVSAVDILLMAAELCFAICGGWLMGRLTQIATVNGATRSRLRPTGLAVWIGFIAIRVGFAVLGGVLGAALASNTAVIIFMIAIVKGTQMLIVKERVSRHESAVSGYRMNAAVGS